MCAGQNNIKVPCDNLHQFIYKISKIEKTNGQNTEIVFSLSPRMNVFYNKEGFLGGGGR